jgi:hypothetical protein
MNRANMAKQITEAPMAGCKTKGMMMGGMAKAGYMKGGMAKKGMLKGGKVKMAKGGMVDQSMCSPRKQMAMGKGK